MSSRSATTRRFVLLWHETPPGANRPSHFDLMLETAEALDTWALAEEPRIGRVQVADRLANHRKAYLDYEGPVSGNRGYVTRWDEGPCRVEQSSDSLCIARLQGRRLRGLIQLQRLGDQAQRWTCRFLPEESADAC